jgi:DNA-binding MarR family transcriptional regulator
VSDPAPVPGIITVLGRTTRAMLAELVERLHQAGYPAVQAAFHPVFENIDDDGSRLTDLARAAGITHQSMSELVGVLEKLGYLERRPDPSDGRVRMVCLTDPGRTLRKLGNEHIRQIQTEWQKRWRRAGISADVRDALAAALDDARPA